MYFNIIFYSISIDVLHIFIFLYIFVVIFVKNDMIKKKFKWVEEYRNEGNNKN